jgi:hypothetical protein
VSTPYDVRRDSETEPASGLGQDTELDAQLAGHQQRHAELSRELTEEETAHQAIEGLRGRLVAWLREQSDVTGVDDLENGIYGVGLAGTHGVSLVVQLTE